MHFHWQNLNERGHEKTGALWRHGRAWLGRWHWEWIIFRPRFGLALAFGHHGESIGGHIEIPFLITLHVHFAVRWGGHREPEFSFYIHEGVMYLKLWGARDEWRSADPWWRQGKMWHFKDILFGRAAYTKEILGESTIVIPMPEGCYEAKMKKERCTWKRPRWPIPLVKYDSWIDIPGGIPVQGKGENSWDCGDDGIFGTGCASHDEVDAIASVVRTVLKDRKRYGNTSGVRAAGVVMARDRVAA